MVGHLVVLPLLPTFVGGELQKSETARIDIDPHAKILPAENRFLIEQQQTLIKTLRTDFGFIFDGNRKVAMTATALAETSTSTSKISNKVKPRVAVIRFRQLPLISQAY